MKVLKRFFVIILIIISAVSLYACNIDWGEQINDALNKIEDYEYSDNGIEEAENFFSEFNSDDYEGKIAYLIKTGGNTINIELYRKKMNNQNNVYMTFDDGNEDYAFLYLGEDSYYIDNKTKKVTNSTEDLYKAMEIGMIIGFLGIPVFEEDGEDKYNFLSKRNATVKDSQGKDIDTVEFEYISVSQDENDQDTTKLYINFHKKLPAVVRMMYSYYDNETDTTNDYVVYVSASSNIQTNIFTLPTETDGYVINITEDEE